MATHTILKLIYDKMTPACYKQKDTVRMESIVQYNTILQAANVTFFFFFAMYFVIQLAKKGNIFSIIVPESFPKAGSGGKAESSSSPAWRIPKLHSGMSRPPSAALHLGR